MSNKAYLYLIKLLSARDYSEHKLREKMREKKFPALEIEEAITDVKDRGYLKEELYAEARIKAFMHKGYSPDYIRQKLKQENVAVDIEEINHVFAEHRLTIDDQIERLVRKKMPRKIEDDQKIDFETQSKILRFVISKGHDFSNSKKILKLVINSSEIA